VPREDPRRPLRVTEPTPDRATGLVLNPRIVALDQRFRFERLAEIHQFVWKGKAGLHGIPVLAAHRERVTAECLAAPVELEARKLDAGQTEAQHVVLLDGSQIDVTPHGRREDHVLIDGEGGQSGGVFLGLAGQLVFGLLHREAQRARGTQDPSVLIDLALHLNTAMYLGDFPSRY